MPPFGQHGAIRASSQLVSPHLPQRRLRPLGDLGVFVLGELLQCGDGVPGDGADHAEGGDGFAGKLTISSRRSFQYLGPGVARERTNPAKQGREGKNPEVFRCQEINTGKWVGTKRTF